MSRVSLHNLTFTYSNFSCDYSWDLQCPCLTPDPDIAGNGVFWSFIAASVMTVLLSFLGLFIDLALDEDNPVDRWTAKVTADYLSDASRKPIKSVTRGLVLSLSDTQLLAGLSTLLIAFAQIETISVYHFNVVASYGSTGFTAHLLSLDATTTWRQELEAAVKKGPRQPTIDRVDSVHASRMAHITLEHPYIRFRSIRALLMTLHFGLVVVSTAITCHKWWEDYYNCNAKCLIQNPTYGPPEVGWTLLWTMLLTQQYLDSLFSLFPVLLKSWNNTLECICQRLEKLTAWAYIPGTNRVYQAIAWICQWILDIFTSQIGKLLFFISWTGWGIQEIVSIVDYGRSYMAGEILPRCPAVEQTETEWGFGQVLPIALLVLPLLGTVTAYETYLLEETVNNPQLPAEINRPADQSQSVVKHKTGSVYASKEFLPNSTLPTQEQPEGAMYDRMTGHDADDQRLDESPITVSSAYQFRDGLVAPIRRSGTLLLLDEEHDDPRLFASIELPILADAVGHCAL